MDKHDSEWTVSTLKSYFEALRGEDQRAITLLARDLSGRLDRMSKSFDELKSSFDRFQASILGADNQLQRDQKNIITVFTFINVCIALFTVIINYIHKS